MLWENLREEEFKGAIERSKGLCVVPIGCLEKHGEHLPVGTDAFWSSGIAAKAAEIEEAVVFPCAPWLGDVVGQHKNDDPFKNDRTGYIGINPHTLLTVLTELCDEIARNGFRKIFFANGHGGNLPLLNYLMRSLGYNKRNYAVMWKGAADPIFNSKWFYETVLARRGEFPDLTDADITTLARYAETGTGGMHADFTETILVAGLRPETVAPDRFEAISGLSTHRADYLKGSGINNTFAWNANYPNAFDGFAPVGATPAIGRAAVQIAAEELAKRFKIIKDDEDCVRMAQGLPKEC